MLSAPRNGKAGLWQVLLHGKSLILAFGKPFSDTSTQKNKSAV
jgi:hypothetical protein